MSRTNARVIVALDYPDAGKAWEFVDCIQPELCKLKVGKELFTREGPQFVGKLVDKGFDVFLDLKFHDIPNTVAGACSAAADLGVWMLNVHAMGGRAMMEAAHDAVNRARHKPRLIAVTVLTSMGREDLDEIGVIGDPTEQVSRLAALAQQSGLDGVVCSAKEVAMLQQQLGKDFCLVTPGIRPTGSDTGDQKRVMNPREAIQAGSHYLVIGRPITQAEDPVEVLLSINAEIAEA